MASSGTVFHVLPRVGATHRNGMLGHLHRLTVAKVSKNGLNEKPYSTLLRKRALSLSICKSLKRQQMLCHMPRYLVRGRRCKVFPNISPHQGPSLPQRPEQFRQCRVPCCPHVVVYRYLFKNSSWNFTIDPTHSVPGARNVVRKCKVPSFCPNPLPATTHTPVASSNLMA